MSAHRSRGGWTLIEVLGYVSILPLVLVLSYEAWQGVADHARDVRRHADDITRALRAGEQWRADVRASTRAPQPVALAAGEELHLSPPGGDVTYALADGIVWRRDARGAVPLLQGVANSRMCRDARTRVCVWRWEVELASRRAVPSVRPLFTFEAVTKEAP